MRPFRLDEEDQDWLEILVKVEKARVELLMWIEFDRLCGVSAILNSGRWGSHGARGRKLHIADSGEYRNKRVFPPMYYYSRHQNRQEIDLQPVFKFFKSTYRESMLYRPLYCCSCYTDG